MPRVVYRESTGECKDLEEEKINDDDKEIEEQKVEVKKKTDVKGEQEMLNAMDLLVALNDKIIDEQVFVTLPQKTRKRQFKEGVPKGKISKVPKAETLHVLIKRKKKGKLRNILRKAQTPSLNLNVSLNRPLSPAYHPSRVVSQVWQENPSCRTSTGTPTLTGWCTLQGLLKTSRTIIMIN